MPTDETGRHRTITRNLQAMVVEHLEEEPVIVLEGARTGGKSTLLQACADARGTQVLDLDDLNIRQAVEADRSLSVAGDARLTWK